MSSVRNPQEKKRMAYTRDHYAKNEYDKARKGWRIKKHKARRSYRHALDSLARAAASDDDESDSKISGVSRRRVRRWGVPSLRERVAHKLDRRARGVGAKKERRAERAELVKAQQAKVQANSRKTFESPVRRKISPFAMALQNVLIIHRDSVCAADDCHAPHQLTLRIKDKTIGQVARELIRRSYLPRIVGGKATWILEAKRPLAVLAQQWSKPRFLVDPTTPAKRCIRERSIPHLYLKYWVQSDPELVFGRLRDGKPLPDRYST